MPLFLSRWFIAVLALLASLVSFNLYAENTMLDFLFKKVDVHLCPPVKGRILENGQPVDGMKVLRQLVFNGGDVLEDSVITDANGEFTMPEKVQRVPKRKISIAANVITQSIKAIDDRGEVYRLWQFSRHGIKENKSAKNKLALLNCDLTESEVYFLFEYNENTNQENKFEQRAFSICRWEDDFKIYKMY